MAGIGLGISFVLRSSVAPTTPVDPSPITIDLQTSRVSGVAPLSVFFDATGTTCTGVTRPFHHLDYYWDFGDTGSYIEDGIGACGAHVFEDPGTYVVTLFVRNPLTGDVNTDTVTVTVSDPDVVFSGANTVCVSTSGTFTGAPSGCTQVTSSNAKSAIDTYATNGKRVLFRRGETFNFAGTSVVNGTTGPISIGAFGTGTSPDARGVYANDPVFAMVITDDTNGLTFLGDDVRICHIHATEGDVATQTAGAFDAAGRTTNCLVHKCSTDGFRSSLGFSQDYIEYLGVAAHDSWCMSQCTWTDARTTTSYVSGLNIAVIGCMFDTNLLSHLLRMTFARKCVIDSNEFISPGSTRHAIKLHAAQNKVVYGTYSEQIVISRNTCDAVDGTLPIAIGPQDAGVDERVREVLIDSCTTIWGSATSSGFTVWSSETTLRNCIVLAVGLSARDVTFAYHGKRGVEPMPSGFECYNNMLYDTSSGSGRENTFLLTDGNYTGAAVPVANNIMYVTGGGASWMNYPGESAKVSLAANILDTGSGGLVFVNAAGGDYRPDTGSTALGAADPSYAFRDALGVTRTHDDIGALARP